jgi:2-desacetyl-2-hydroxyethyl bacteriochlorophyllide A dehydrogenase
MDYIICEEPGRLQLGKKEQPRRQPHEALVAIKKVGICGTDLHAYQGNQAFFTYPRILGHELAGQIVEIENHSDLVPGDKVVIMPYLSCGQCIACRQQKTNCCTELQVLGVHVDGGMQQFITVRNDLLIKANFLTYEEMAIVEPLSIGAHAVRRASLEQNEQVLVMGCGPIGLGIMKMAQLQGATVIGLDKDEYRLQYAKSSLGIDHILHVTKEPLKQLQEITNNDLATIVFDATGNKIALESGIKYMAHGGRYILVGLSKGDISFNHPLIHSKEASIMSSRNATIEDFKKVISVLQQKLFPVDSYITAHVHYREMVERFDDWVQPANGNIKAIVDF